MIRDAIVDEVRAIRDEIAKEHGYDIHELFKTFRHIEATSGRAHASFPARKSATFTAQGIDADEPEAKPTPRS
jgi:hypothetical protein